jgi:hypothetical protein
MTTNFPASLDNFTNPTSLDTLNSPSHSDQHADVNDAVEALQAKVGADSSAVTTSLDYKVSQLETNSVTLSGSETLTNKTIDLTDNTVTGTLAEFSAAVSDADLVSLDGSETLTNKTLTSPVINTATINNSVVQGLEERWTYTNQAITGAEVLEVLTSPARYNWGAATGNFTLSVRGNSGTTLDSLLTVSDSITVAFAVTNGATAYYMTEFRVDNVAQTVKWQGGAAPTAGNANSVDVYVFTILKTDATPTYVVLGSLTQFA